MTEVKALKNQMKGLATEFALTWMIQKGSRRRTFFWDGKLWTVETAKKEWEKDIQEMLCGEVGVLRFFGGPPGSAKWHDGTILSMLCDMILFDESTVGLTPDEKLGV
jgi:hypothetical protein